MIFEIFEIECLISDRFCLIILLNYLIRRGFMKDLVPPYRFLYIANMLVDLKDLITLRENVLYFSSNHLCENFLPIIGILLIVRGSCNQRYIIDDVISFKFVEGL